MCRSTEIKGRISATLALIYPPGIGVIVPGERWDDRAQPMLDYFLAFQESFNRFPGFNYEVQGVFQERVDGRIKFHTYVGPRVGRRDAVTRGGTHGRASSQPKRMNLMQLTFIVAVNMMGSGHHHAADQHGAGRRDLAAVLDRHGARLDGHRLRLRPGRSLQPAPRRHVGLCRGRLRQVRLLPGLPPLLPVAGDRQRRDRHLGGRLPCRRSSRFSRRRRSRPASA